MVGGDGINYPGKVTTLTAEMLVAKMLFNSVISTKGAWFMTMGISNFYLMTPLHCAKIIQIKLSNIPNEVINKYKLREKNHQKWQHLHQSQARHVWPPTNRIICEQTPRKTPQQTRIPKKQVATWPLDTPHKTNTVHTGCWQYWHEISQQRTCATSQECTWITLQTYVRLDRQMIHWDNIGLGLQQVPGPSVHAKLCAESFETISTQSRQTTACTIPKCTDPIWTEHRHNTQHKNWRRYY